MTKEICGISFNEMPNSIWTENRELTIFATDEAEQSFRFGTTDIAPYSGLFAEFNCTALSVTGARPPAGKFDLDLVERPERIRLLSLDASSYRIPVRFTAGKIYFPGLRKLAFTGHCPEDFPDLEGNDKLVQLRVQYDREFLSHWTKLKQLKDLVIYDYDEPDLKALKGLDGLVRLTIAQGKMKSLEGLQEFPSLQTLVIAKAPKLINLEALTDAPSLQNIMFQDYKKVTDWSFLMSNQKLAHLALDVVESVDFRSNMPRLKFLYVRKVISRRNKSYLFETEDRYENTMPDGTDINYIPDHEVFYNDIA